MACSTRKRCWRADGRPGREGGGRDLREPVVALCVGSTARCRLHNDARDAQSLRVELPALKPRERTDCSVERREPDGELEVGWTETPSFVNVLQDSFQLPHQLRTIAIPQVE